MNSAYSLVCRIFFQVRMYRCIIDYYDLIKSVSTMVDSCVFISALTCRKWTHTTTVCGFKVDANYGSRNILRPVDEPESCLTPRVFFTLSVPFP